MWQFKSVVSRRTLWHWAVFAMIATLDPSGKMFGWERCVSREVTRQVTGEGARLHPQPTLGDQYCCYHQPVTWSPTCSPLPLSMHDSFYVNLFTLPKVKKQCRGALPHLAPTLWAQQGARFPCNLICSWEQVLSRCEWMYPCSCFWICAISPFVCLLALVLVGGRGL